MIREILLLTALVVSIPFVLKRPWLGIALYMGANIIRPEMLFWGGLQGNYVFKVYYGFTVFSCLRHGCLNNMPSILNRRFIQMVWLIIAVGVSIVCAQYENNRTGVYTMELVKGLGICALAYMVCDYHDARKIQKILLGCIVFLGIWGIEQSFRGNVRLEGLGGGSFADSNGVAAVFVLFFPVAFARLYSSKTRREFWASVLAVAVIVGLIFCTKSRGGLLGLTFSVLALGFYSRSLRKTLPVASLIVVLILPLAGKAYFDRMKTMENVIDADTLEGSARSRLILWQTGLMVFSANPVFGTGFLTYPEAKMKYEDRFTDIDLDLRQYVFRTTAKKVVHNTYIQVLSDCGLFGAIPFFLLVTGGLSLGLAARRLFIKLPEKSDEIVSLCGVCAGIAGFAVCILFIDALLQPFLFLQITFADIMLKSIREGVAEETIEDLSGLSLVGGRP